MYGATPYIIHTCHKDMAIDYQLFYISQSYQLFTQEHFFFTTITIRFVKDIIQTDRIS